MSQAIDATVSRLLDDLQGGSRSALNELVPLVYQELRQLARQHRRRWSGDETLDTTALVHEAYVKLVGHQQLSANDRAHFLAVAGRAMRQILSDYARARRRLKRGGAARPVSLGVLDVRAGASLFGDSAGSSLPPENDAIAALDGALTALERTDQRLSRVVECRFFAGLSIAETATVLGTSPATVKRDWTLARAWLYRAMHAPARTGQYDG